MSKAFPPLREELSLLPGAPLHDGQPSWVLHDPARNLFFQLDWPSFEILSRWQLGESEAILGAIHEETTLTLGSADIERLLQFLSENQLLTPPPGSAPNLAQRLFSRQGSKWQWLLHNYLFFRIPLIKPDAWLSQWSPRIEFLFSPVFLRLTLAALVLGLISIYRDWERFSNTLVDMLTWGGLAAYGATLVTVKVLHEFGHAFTAKRYGCRIPTMGLAFLVMWPMPYTDTNETWKLQHNEQRLRVAAAGIVTELIIAAWATLAWLWLPEGLPKSIAFLLATTTWISTLAINASPFMRFDGYFLLSDYLGLPNLHTRAFNLARWDLRERLFGLGDPVPEHFPPRQHLGLIVFAWITWLYRLVVFLGIAALVYHFFIKALGIFLFLVEIVWFIAWPLWSEVRIWRERWSELKGNPRPRRSALIGAAILLTFVIPWPTRIGGSGMLKPLEQFAIYAPSHALVEALPIQHGQALAANTQLIHMVSPDIQVREAQNMAKRQQLALQSGSASFDDEQRKNWQLLNEQLSTAEAEFDAVTADTQHYRPIAPFAGRMVDMDPDLKPGNWVGHRELLGRLVGEGPWQVVTYVDEEDVHRLSQGDRGLFLAEGMAGPDLRLEVTSVDKDTTRILAEPELASLYGGHLVSREKQGMLFPERAVYRVALKVVSDTPPLLTSLRGQVVIAGNWEAPGLRFLKSALTVFWREMGF